jgi:hypothetical protein
MSLAAVSSVIDMHRFYEPAGQPKLAIKSAYGVQAQFDARKFELRLKIGRAAKELVDLPFTVEGGQQGGHSHGWSCGRS